VVLNAVAASDDPRRDERVRHTLTTAFRILLVSGPCIVLAAGAVTVLDLWPTLLGNGLMPGGSTVVFVCVCIFGLVLPLTAGQRILIATGRTGTQIATQGVIAPFILLTVSVLVLVEAPAGRWLAVLSFLGTALVSMLCLAAGARVLRPQVGLAVRDIPRLRRVPSVPVIAVAGPMLFQMVLLPVATQSDRLLLSHLTTGSELAEYTISSQLFGIALQTVTAAGLALWPVFARARAAGEVRSPVQLAVVFAAAGLLLSSVVAVASPFLVRFVSDGQLRLDRVLVLAFVALVTVQALKYPLGMYMTDERGLRFQVLPIVVLVPTQVVLSWTLIGVVGAAGPVLSGAIASFACQVVPYWWYVRRDLGRRRAVTPRARTGPAGNDSPG
jgi:O-antigen/teichoic acid export membrane protein